MSLLLFAPIAALLAPAAVTAADVPIFERVQMDENVAVTTFGIIEDTRCAEPALCFADNRLVVAAIIEDGDRQNEVSLELGRPVALASGTLMLASTATPANPSGATRLARYRLDLVYRPYQ